MSIYEIQVNGSPLREPAFVEAKSRGEAVDIWLIEKYGSVLSSSAPYNVSARKTGSGE